MAEKKDTSKKWEKVAEQAESEGKDPDDEILAEMKEAALKKPVPLVDDEHSLSYEDLQTQVEKETARAEEYHDKFLRLQADLENIRRRAKRDVEDAHKYGVTRLVEALLPVVDSLERGLEIDAEENGAIKAMREGMELTLKMFLDVMAKNGLEQINPMGQPFDPAHHEAISMQDGGDAEPNTVLTVVQKGYLLNERVVRPAMVVVAKKG